MKKAEISITGLFVDIDRLKAIGDRAADLSEPLQAAVKIIASAVTAEQPAPKFFEALAAIEQVIELHELCQRQQGELADLSANGVTTAAPEATQQLRCIGRITVMNNMNASVLVNDTGVPWKAVFKPEKGESVYVIREQAAS